MSSMFRVNIVLDEFWPPPSEALQEGLERRLSMPYVECEGLWVKNCYGKKYLAWVPQDGQLGKAWPNWLARKVFDRAHQAAQGTYPGTNYPGLCFLPPDQAYFLWQLGLFSPDPKRRAWAEGYLAQAKYQVGLTPPSQDL